MSIFQTALAIVATNVGGGILGVPYAFYHLGIFNAAALCLFLAVTGQVSVMLHLRIKDLSPHKYESVYELAYFFYGRPAIFVLIAIYFSSALSCMVLYYMILGDTVGHLWGQAFVENARGREFKEIKDEVSSKAWYV